MLLRRVSFPDFVGPCLPSPVDQPPAGADWIHQNKHDGFRMLARRRAKGVRLFIRNGHDWTERFPQRAQGRILLDRRGGGRLPG
jgi:bifunctional non-homologous end joining protein LigD